MKPFLAGTLATAIILTGWLAGTRSEPELVEPPPIVTSTIPVTFPPAPSTSSTSSTTTTTEPPAPLVFPDTPCQEWIPLAVELGWPADIFVLHRLGTTMWRESRCGPGSFNRDDPNGGSRGLMQINGFWCQRWLQDQGLVSACDDLFDPATNLRAALAIFTYSTFRNGNGWHPWRT